MPGAAQAPALWAAMCPPPNLHSPFSSPAIQMLPAGIADAAQRLMNGGAAAAVSAAPHQAASQPPLPSAPQAERLSGDSTEPLQSNTETLEDTAVLTEVAQEDPAPAASEGLDVCIDQEQQPEACNGPQGLSKIGREEADSPVAGAEEGDQGVEVPVQVHEEALRKLAELQQIQSGMNGSFSIPDTPSLGEELRGGFVLPQHMDSLKVCVASLSRML